MRFILGLILIIGLGAAAQLYFPWWIIVAVCFIIGLLFGMGSFNSFSTGFLGVLLLWGGYALYLNNESGNRLTEKMADLFPIEMSGVLLILACGLLGGLIGGLATMTGSLGRNMFRSKVVTTTD